MLNFFIIFLSILLTLIFLNVYSGSLFFFTNLCYLDHCLAVFSFNQVHGPGADIDTLCVGPSYVNREVHFPDLELIYLFLYVLTRIFCLQEDFFFVLHNILAEMEEVSELQPVPDAHVPVMKFKLDGISIDLLYASISLLVVPDVSGLSFLL